MPDKQDNHEIVKREQPPVVLGLPVRSIRLGEKEELDLSNLSVREAEALEVQAHEKAIERDDRRQRLKEDLAVTAAKVNTFTTAVNDAAAQNAAVTITNQNKDSLGETQMIFGNTDAARSGKLTRSQQGLSDNANFWILLVVIAGIVIVLVAAFSQ